MLNLRDPGLLRQSCYINGAWVAADSGEIFSVINPATGAPVATVPRCGAAETERAIHAAEQALKSWRQTTAAERSRILRRWFDLMMENQNDLAALMTAEQGKPLAESKKPNEPTAKSSPPRSGIGNWSSSRSRSASARPSLPGISRQR